MKKSSYVAFQTLYLEPSRNGLMRPKRVRGAGFKMINMGELFTHDRINNPPMDLVPMTASEIDRFGIRQWDLVFARQSLIAEGAGKCSIVLQAPEVTTFESHLIRVRLNSAYADPLYYYYYFQSPYGKGNVQSIVMQVAAAGIRASELATLLVPKPSLAEQRCVASILSAYDDLIEKNRRRIAILEEMARRIYEEWFVHFRFLGHEDVRMVESELGLVPEGWEISSLQDVCEGRNGIQTGPFGSQLHKADYSEEGVPVLMPKDLIGFRVEEDTVARVPEETAQSLSRHRMWPGDIAYGRRGDIGRRAYIMAHQSGWMCGTGCLRIRPDVSRVNNWYVFNYLGQQSILGLIAGRAHGVTMPNLNARLLQTVPVLLPPRVLQDCFEKISFPMAQLREILIAKNRNLRTTRDLLLPKLISGEIDVSAIPAPESIAA